MGATTSRNTRLVQRTGSRTRLLDGERFTIAIGGNYICDGICLAPKVVA